MSIFSTAVLFALGTRITKIDMVISRTERKKTGPLPPNFGVFALCFFLFAVLSLASALSLGLGWRSFNDFFLARGIDPERDIAENLLQAYRFLEELACAIPFAAGIAFSLMVFSRRNEPSTTSFGLEIRTHLKWHLLI